MFVNKELLFFRNHKNEFNFAYIFVIGEPHFRKTETTNILPSKVNAECNESFGNNFGDFNKPVLDCDLNIYMTLKMKTSKTGGVNLMQLLLTPLSLSHSS